MTSVLISPGPLPATHRRHWNFFHSVEWRVTASTPREFHDDRNHSFLSSFNCYHYRYCYYYYHHYCRCTNIIRMGFDFTVSGLGVPANAPNSTANGSSSDSMLAYQANLHQAFLQSAMAQNIQIQQQILAQNQALHQLLQQQQLLPPVRPYFTRPTT